MKQIVKDSVSIEKEIFISSSSEALFKKYAKSCQIKISSDCEALCGTFPKNVARCLHLVKKDTICEEFPQNAKDSPASFPELGFSCQPRSQRNFLR